MKTKHTHWAVLTASTLGLTGLSLASGFGDEKYTYDASGNVLEKQIGDQVTRYDYTGNQLNGSTSDSTRTQYAYDSSGRLTSDSEAGKPTRNMEHQYLDKVTKVQNGDKTTEFFYNAEGQLVATNSAGTSETFAWDGLAMVNRGDQLYVNEAHAVGGVPAIVGNEVAVSDMIGSSLSVGNGSFESTAFGEGLAEGAFTGKPYIGGLDGFLFKYRTYSADDGRWTTLDPSGFPDGSNSSSYVNGDPVSKIDRLGLEQISLTCHWTKDVDGTTFAGDASTIFNYTFVIDSNNKRRLDKHDFAGDSAYVGTTDYTSKVEGTINVYDVDGDGAKETVQTTETVYGTYSPSQRDASGLLVESMKDNSGVKFKRDVVKAELWIDEPVSTSTGYLKSDGTFVSVNGPTGTTSQIDIDVAMDYGDWIEQ